MSAQKATQPISHERKLALLRTASASRKLTVWYRDHKRLLLRLVFITCNRAHKSSPTNWTIVRFRLRFCSGESVFRAANNLWDKGCTLWQSCLRIAAIAVVKG